MTLCKCGCGNEVREGKQFVNGGHYFMWKKAQKAIKEELKKEPEETHQTLKVTKSKDHGVLTIMNKYRILRGFAFIITLILSILLGLAYYNFTFGRIKGFTLWIVPYSLGLMALVWFFLFVNRIAFMNLRRNVFLSTKSVVPEKLEKVESAIMLVENLPSWSVDARKPGFIFQDEEKEVVQIVLVSTRSKWKFLWAMWNPTELLLSIGNQAYEVTNGISSGIILLNKDTGKEIKIDDEADETLDSVHKEQIKNFYYSKGRLEGAGALTKQLSLLVIIGVLTLIAVFGVIYINYTTSQDIMTNLNYINQSISQIPKVK